jgi:hypothetical protein
MKTSTILFLLIISNILLAGSAEEQLKKLNVKAEFYYETPFNHQCFEKVSTAKVIEAGLVYASAEVDATVFSSNHLFLLNGENISMFNTAYQLFTSPEFTKTIRTDFKINNKDEAAIFQDLLYLVDQRSSWTSFFKQENNWFFIRKTFFEDIEAWKVSTNANGNITAIEFSSKMEVTVPEEVFEIDYPSLDYEPMDDYVLPDLHAQKIQEIIDGKIGYKESTEEITNETLKAVSDAAFYRFSFSLEEEITDEDGTYTSSTNQVFDAIDFKGNMQLFYDFTGVLESPVFLESLKPSFVLKEEADAMVFEAMLDDFTNYMRSQKMLFLRGDTWYFVRDESFSEKEGFIVKIDPDGKIINISYSSNLGIDIPEEEFDETTADWGFNLILPESNSLEIVEGASINYVLEFNEKPVTQMGAWVLTTLNGQNHSMDAGSEIYSPVYGDIRGSELPLGKHTLDFYLMRPGMDTGTALGKASVEINVVPFNDEGVTWDFVMNEPKSNTVKSLAGESVPVSFTFNAEQANRLGVRLDIYFQGQLVGGQKPPHLQSPFQTSIPGSEMKKGKNKVEFVFAGGSKTLARFEVNVEVE